MAAHEDLLRVIVVELRMDLEVESTFRAVQMVVFEQAAREWVRRRQCSFANLDAVDVAVRSRGANLFCDGHDRCIVVRLDQRMAMMAQCIIAFLSQCLIFVILHAEWMFDGWRGGSTMFKFVSCFLLDSFDLKQTCR